MISVVHLAGPVVRMRNFLTQRCLLCGRVLMTVNIDDTRELAGVDDDGGQLYRVPIIRPLNLVRLTDRPMLFGLGPVERTVETVRDMSGAGLSFDGEHELPPGTCVLEGRQSVPLRGGPFDSGWYHAPRGLELPLEFEMYGHTYRVDGTDAVYAAPKAERK